MISNRNPDESGLQIGIRKLKAVVYSSQHTVGHHWSDLAAAAAARQWKCYNSTVLFLRLTNFSLSQPPTTSIMQCGLHYNWDLSAKLNLCRQRSTSERKLLIWGRRMARLGMNRGRWEHLLTNPKVFLYLNILLYHGPPLVHFKYPSVLLLFPVLASAVVRSFWTHPWFLSSVRAPPAKVQPRLIQGVRSGDGGGEDQDTIASIRY